MTSPIGPNTGNGYNVSAYSTPQYSGGNSQYGQYNNQPMFGSAQSGYYGDSYSYSNGDPYGLYAGGNPNDLGSLTDLGPLSYQVYSGYDTPPYVQPGAQQYPPGSSMGDPYAQGQQGQYPPNLQAQGQPPPPSYIDDSPAGFAANVIDPMLGTATQTYRETSAMIDEYEKTNQKK